MHDGGVGFTKKLAVGELTQVKSSPLSLFDWEVGSVDLWVPRVSGCSFRVLFDSFPEVYANFGKSYLELYVSNLREPIFFGFLMKFSIL